MELKTSILFLICSVSVLGLKCPKQCDCDLFHGLNRATCVDQNIISIDVGVPTAVQAYSLRNNVISELHNYCFKESGYTAIRILDISYNLIFWIGIHAFSGLEELTHLDLSNNRLREVPLDVFRDTPLLEVLDLSANIFESLRNEPLLMHDKLQVLNLNNCRMKTVPKRLFTRLPNLRKLDLSENYMVTISVEALSPIPKLEKLVLKSDYLKCSPDFKLLESWIASNGVSYEAQCTKKMSEKMILSTESPIKIEHEIKGWNITTRNETAVTPAPPLTPFEKFDKDFSAFQAFIMGVQIGLGVGIVGTYIWLRKFCTCGKLDCTRPQTRRERRRRELSDAEAMRTNLLWPSGADSEWDTPPQFRRERGARALPSNYGLPRVIAADLQIDAIRVPSERSETPPPPYNTCRINI